MIKGFDEHVRKSFERLSSKLYSIENIWQNDGYEWAGDWEGRALLAFVCLYEITGEKIPCMDKMLEEFPLRLNEKGYLGAVQKGVADEQQLSGHSWLLRGLTEYFKVFKTQKSLDIARGVVEGLFLPLVDLYEKYPTERADSSEGGVSGNSKETVDGWKLSTDVGCAYMCLDGLSAYYEITGDERVKTAVNRLIDGFMRLDRLKMKCQTHATLSATRGIIRMYKATGERGYLEKAEELFGLYTRCGMTLTYENFNWFERKDSWTEPCAVVDSFIVAVWLFEITKNQEYKTLASRIWFNGLLFCHRENGGAGPNSCVTAEQPYLKISMYEAPFCCTMRYCEGLLFAKNYESVVETSNEITSDEYGRIFIGNEMLALSEDGAFENVETVVVGGTTYIKIPTLVKDTSAKLKVVGLR